MKAEWILLAVFVFLMLSMPAIGQTDQSITCKQGNYFIQNVGQLDDPSILYYSDIPTGRIYVRQDDIVFQFIESKYKENDIITRFSPESRFRSDFPYREKEEPCPRIISNVYVTFLGSDFTEIIPEDEQVTKINIFKGNDPNKWRTDIPTFGAVRIKNLYENVDLVIGGDRNDSKAQIWHLDGDINKFNSVKMKVDANQAEEGLIIPSPEELKPTQAKNAESQPQPQGQQLLWGSYLGGTDYDWNSSIAIDSSGHVIVSFETLSLDVPCPDGYQQSFNGGSDLCVAKLDSDGHVLFWGTYIGGSAPESHGLIGLDSEDNIVLAGATCSYDIPVLNAYQNRLVNNRMHMYVAKLSSFGNFLMWATFLEGSEQDEPYDVIVDPYDNVLVAGWTFSPDIPVPNGFDQTYNGDGVYDGGDIYVGKLSSLGNSLLWGTYLGGSDTDMPYDLTLDASNNVVVGGYTNSPDIQVPNGYDTSFNGDPEDWDCDIYLAKLSSDGSRLLWGTFIGGSEFDAASGVEIDPHGDIIIGGGTCSPDIPVPQGYDQMLSGDPGVSDFYAAKLSGDGRTLLWGTYLGMKNREFSQDLQLDVDGNAYLIGYTWSSDMPVPNGFDPSPAPGQNAYLARLSNSGASLMLGTYIDGHNESGTAISPVLALDSFGNIVVMGTVNGPNLPASDGYDQTFNGGRDLFLLELSDLPIPVMGQVVKLVSPFRLKLTGSNFRPDCQVFIGGDISPWPTVVYKSGNLLLLKGGNSLKNRFPKGVPVEIKVVNGDGGSARIAYTR